MAATPTLARESALSESDRISAPRLAIVGVSLILLGAGIALASSTGYGRFVKTLPRQDVSSGYLIGFGSIINLVIAAVGIVLAGYLLVSGLQAR